MIIIPDITGFPKGKPRHNDQHPKYYFHHLETEKRCIHSLEVFLWWDENADFLMVRCPRCRSENIKIVKKGKFNLYQCKCRKQFSVLSCTPFKGIKIDIFKVFHMFGFYEQRYPYLRNRMNLSHFDEEYKTPYSEIAEATGVDTRTVKKIFGIFSKIDSSHYYYPDGEKDDYEEKDDQEEEEPTQEEEADGDEERRYDNAGYYCARLIRRVKQKYRLYIRCYPYKLK
jgi:hypothetical protein